MRHSYNISEGKPVGKGRFGRRRHRYGDNIKLDLRETGCDNVDRIRVVKDRKRFLVDTVMNLRVPQMVGYFLNDSF
jgi:hypothetical protein